MIKAVTVTNYLKKQGFHIMGKGCRNRVGSKNYKKNGFEVTTLPYNKNLIEVSFWLMEKSLREKMIEDLKNSPFSIVKISDSSALISKI